MTKEEFFIEMEKLTKELEEIKEGLARVRAQGDLSENIEYDQLRKRQHEIYETVEWYETLIDKTTSYKDFIWAYGKFKEYSKKHDLEEVPFLDDKIQFLEEQFIVEFNYYPPTIWDFERDEDYVKESLKKDLRNVLKYFRNKKEKDIYKWELDYVTLLLFYDQMCHTSYVTTLFEDYKELERTEECEELLRNSDQIIKDLDNNTFSFNLLLWTAFKIYQYLYNKNSEFIFNKSDLVLIDRLLILGRRMLSRDFDQRTIKENKDLDEEEKYFIFSLSQLLCLDLIHTIYNGFPDYYDTCIMYLGYGLHIPAGCSDLTTSMKTFERFINGITDYDYWLELEGPEMFEKMNIQYDYKKVLKDNDLI